MSEAIGRRGFLGGIAGMVAGLFGRPAAAGETAAIAKAVGTLKPTMAIYAHRFFPTENVHYPADMDDIVRRWCSRGPLPCRIPGWTRATDGIGDSSWLDEPDDDPVIDTFTIATSDILED